MQEDLEYTHRAGDMEKQAWRKWKAGDVYAPHDLSQAEMAKWKLRALPREDVFDKLGIKPLEEYKVCVLP